MCQGIVVQAPSRLSSPLLDHEDESTTLLWKVRNYWPISQKTWIFVKMAVRTCIVCFYGLPCAYCFRWSRGIGARRCHEARPRNWKTVAAMSQWSIPYVADNIERTCGCRREAVGAPYLSYCSSQPAAEVYDSAADSVSHGTSHHGLWVNTSTRRSLWLPIWKLSLLRLVGHVIMQS